MMPNVSFTSEVAEGPFRVLMIDCVGPIAPETPRGNRYCFTAVDLFTDWGWVVPLPTIDAESVATALVERVFCDMGFPCILRSDRGTEFVNKVVSAVNSLFQIRHVLGSAYHPRGQSRIETSHIRLNEVIAKLTDEDPSEWDLKVGYAQWAWRTAPKARLGGLSPFEVVTGLRPMNPVDAIVSGENRQLIYRDAVDYVSDMRERMKQVHEIVREGHRVAAKRTA